MSNDPRRVLAGAVDDWLAGQGVELTMGGEPTFISDDPTGAEWNQSAIGPEKLGYARRMMGRLLADSFPGALIMQVFGKQYPGEALPRWNLLSLHDAEGLLWPWPERLLLDDRPGKATSGQARTLVEHLADALVVDGHPQPLAEAGDAQGTVGWVLPLDRDETGWITQQWPVDDQGHVLLIPGDSPAGLRLPLQDLPEDALRRALTVEARDGALEIFFPPLDAKGFQALLVTLREATERLDLADLVFCGYPPADAYQRFTILGLASDPGVLEANLPACADWAEYDEMLRCSHEAAVAEGLQLTKRALNGAVHGTGGGSHLTFGGPDLSRNPFLAQPARIASLLRYWQHHPSLSYLFTGQFVGPGSQAPRIDEGPRHTLYELEVACEGIERLIAPADPETIDHFLRHLATDSAGNTHRSELCFDKFGNAGAPNGRMGIIELRAFETVEPLEAMATTALFIRTILARLFKHPFDRPLRRFGARLHDRWFLPAVLWEDIGAICEDLTAAGFPFERDWLAPVRDFRFPVVGTLDTPAGPLEVRQALESWPLLAEESAGAATVRTVDNSTDRLQLRLPADARASGVLVANGVRVPFQDVAGEPIAGLRYKCASAWPALHPHVPVQSPLRLDWLDDQGTVRAAVDYHYWNPDGPVYEGRPADQDEAGERRRARWRDAPDRLGNRLVPREPRHSPEYEMTLDLRRCSA